MPPRETELPEGTDKIVAGASRTETTAGTGSTGGGTTTGGTGGGSGSGRGGSSGGATSRSSGGTSGGGGFVARGGGNDTGGTAGGGGGADKIVSQVRDQVNALRDQASGKAREFAEGGKDRTTQLLDDIAEIIHDAARSIDDRLGDQYGEYAHKAGDAVQGLAGNLREKNLEDLIEGTRSIVRKSPAVTVGTAALLGFILVRLVKSGLESAEGGGNSSSGGGRRSGSGSSGGGA